MNWQAADINPLERIIVALDVSTADEALALARRLAPFRSPLKIGLQLHIAAGPEIVRALRDLGARIFLDLKLHDIPNTVARAVESAGSLGVEMLTLHLPGGRAMIEAAVRAAPPGLLLLGVTVLTSVDEMSLRETGVQSSIEDQVLRLAKLGVESGMGGIVASPLELTSLRHAFGRKIKIVTPGVRPAGAAPDDQKRTLTPAEAIRAGADFLVIGRPITSAKDPRAALEQIAADAI
ncbi:MAG TPA: orotidine-5'-phosphate decarboxylase [Chthoniobacterales bacterium]|jgi:orotidine-5'-phosphate decarboxylase